MPRAPNTAASPGRSIATKRTPRNTKAVPSAMAHLLFPSPFKNVAHRRGVPLTTAGRRDPSGVQCPRNVPQSGCARLLCLADDGQNVGGELVSRGRHRLHRALTSHVEPLVSKGYPTSLCCCESLPGPCADKRAFLLGQRGEQVQHEQGSTSDPSSATQHGAL